MDDILEVIDDENTEDIGIMAGIIDWEDSDKDYLDVSVWQHAKNRLPWLLILMVAYVFTGMIVTSFENRLSEVICLVAYMPMLMGTGGNTGSQAATLIIRGLAMGEVETSHAAKVLWKEVRIGLIVGVIRSAFNFARICIFDGYRSDDSSDGLQCNAGDRGLCKDHRKHDPAAGKEDKPGPGTHCQSGHIVNLRCCGIVHLFSDGVIVPWPVIPM